MISTTFRVLLSVVMLLSVICGSQCAAAVVAYDNIDLNLIKDYRQRSYLGNLGSGVENKLAQRFTPTTSGQLSKLEMTLVFRPIAGYQNIDELTLSIVADENGKPGTTNLWSEVFIDETGVEGVYPSSFNVANGLSLHEGTNYWVVARTTSEGRFPYIWYLGGVENTGTAAQYYFNAPTGVVTGEWLVNFQANRREFGLRVTVIPEPTAAALMLAASATLLAVRRRTISI